MIQLANASHAADCDTRPMMGTMAISTSPP